MGCTDKVCTDSALTHLAAFKTHLKNIVPTHYACAYAYACDARMGDPGCRVWVQDQSYVRDHHSSRRKTDFKGIPRVHFKDSIVATGKQNTSKN